MNKRLLSGLVLLSGLLLSSYALADDDDIRPVYHSAKQLVAVDFSSISHSEGRSKTALVIYGHLNNYMYNGNLTYSHMQAECNKNTLVALSSRKVNTNTDTSTGMEIILNPSQVNVRNNPADRAIYNAICYGISLED